MKEIRFNIPELKDIPPDRQKEILQRCVDSEEFARRWGRIKWITFVSYVAGVVAVINVLDWTVLRSASDWLVGIFAVATVVFFIAVMLVSQIWFRVRLVRKFVRREVANA